MFRNLNPVKIEKTVRALSSRIAERFPDSGLSKICQELLEVVKTSEQNCMKIRKPSLWLRIPIYLTILLILMILFSALWSLEFPNATHLQLAEFVEVLDAGMNATVLIGAAVLFLITAETRIKRRNALKAVHELRALAHVIDMHQLTKDPERILANWKGTASSPLETLTAFQLTRYLDYCSEMLSLLGKIAALYGQDFDDEVVLASVSDLETLTTELSQKIWQKIIIIHSLENKIAPTSGTTMV